MDISKLSSKYFIKKLTETDVGEILRLCENNHLFYQFHPPLPTRQSILEDINALPPGKTYEDKFYIGFWNGDILVSVMDLILDYPEHSTAFIGFFIMNAQFQGNGTGTAIIQNCLIYLAECGFQQVQLGIDKGNPQSEAFWKKNGFIQTGRAFNNDSVSYVYMMKMLNR